jgi:uncharacterized caspase-like protein
MTVRHVASSGPAAAEPLVEGRRVVAVIGIDRYRGWPMLSNAVHDARGALTLFERCGFAPITPPLVDDAATGDAIRRLVSDDLAALRNTDSLVVFFAGHGHTQTRTLHSGPVETGYLIPVDGDQPGGQTASWLRLDNWLSDIARLPARHILVVLDACHSGIALGSLIKWRDSGEVRDAALDELRRRQSRRVITSALGDQRAMDSGPLHGHSLFTGCLIEGLTGGLARDGRREVTASEIGLYLQQRVAGYTKSSQTPDFGALELDQRGELVVPLASAAPVDAPAAALAPPQAPAAHTLAAGPAGAAPHAATRAPAALAPEWHRLTGAAPHASGAPTGPTSAALHAASRPAAATPGRPRPSEPWARAFHWWNTELSAWARKFIVVGALGFIVFILNLSAPTPAENRPTGGAGAPPSAASAATQRPAVGGAGVVERVDPETGEIHVELPPPPELAPPLADKAGEVPALEAALAADPAYAKLWNPDHADDRNTFLTAISDALAHGTTHSVIDTATKKAKLYDAFVTTNRVLARTGKLPSNLTPKIEAHLASVRTAPRHGLWNPDTPAQPLFDATAVALWLHPNDVEYVRERLRALVNGSFRERGDEPITRKWLALEDVIGRLRDLGAFNKDDCTDLRAKWSEKVLPNGQTQYACEHGDDQPRAANPGRTRAPLKLRGSAPTPAP